MLLKPITMDDAFYLSCVSKKHLCSSYVCMNVCMAMYSMHCYVCMAMYVWLCKSVCMHIRKQLND